MRLGLGLGLGASSRQWTPWSLGSQLLGLWLADYGVTHTNGLVDQWDPWLNNGALPSFVSTTTKRPLLESSKWNSKNVIYGAVGKNLRWNAAKSITRPFTIVIVGTQSTAGAKAYELGEDAIADKGVWYGTNNSMVPITNLGSSISNWSTKTWVAGHALSTNAPSVLVHECGTTHATHKLYSNGFEWSVSSFHSNDPGTTAFNGRMNLFSDQAGSYPGAGRVQAVALVSGIMNSGTRSLFTQWLWNYLSMSRRWELGMLGDSLLAEYGALKAVRKAIYNALDPSDSACFDYSTPNEKITDQTNRYNGISGGVQGGCGSIKGIDCVKAFLEMDGANDILNGVSASTILANKQARITAIKANNPSAKRLVAKLLPASFYNSGQQAVRTAVNAGVDSLTDVHRVITAHIAPYASGGLGNGNDTALYSGFDYDTLHENDAGRDRLGAIFKEELKEFGGILF